MANAKLRYNGAVQKIKSFRFTVRLFWDGHKAVRFISIYADRTFQDFHNALQKAFGWEHCCLYNFAFYENDEFKQNKLPEIELIDVESLLDSKPIEIPLCDYFPQRSCCVYTCDYEEGRTLHIELIDIY